MKTNNVFILALTGITFLVASCSETLNNVEEPVNYSDDEKSSQVSALQGDCCTFSGTLSDEDIAGLMEMREEEKLARDVYAYFYELFGHVIFSNISASEDTHTSAVLQLINGYGLTDPTPDIVAEFSNPLFTGLYEKLTSDGSDGLVEALQTGAFIEEYDIADLQKYLAVTENEDILKVYGNLLEGSKNHLRAFTATLNRLGETYSPTVISEEEYEEILSESNNKGNSSMNQSGQGTGNNYGNKYGNTNSKQNKKGNG